MVDAPSSNHSSRTAQRQSSGGVGNVSGQGISTPLPNNVVVSRPPLDVYKNLSIIFKSTDSVMYETFVTTTTTTTDASSSGAVATSSSESQRNIPSLLSTKSLDDNSPTVDPKSSQQHHGATSTTTTQLKCVPVAELGEVALKATPMTLQQQQANKSVTTKLNIPVPQIDPVQDYVTRNYRIPKSFVRHLKPFTSHHVRYTVDLEDEQWIKRHPLYEDNYDYTQDVKSSQLFSKARLTVSLFEDMINLLEEGTGFETIIRLDQAQALFATHLSSDGFKPSPSNKKVVAVASQGTQQQSKLRGVSSSSSSALQSSDATMILQQTSLQLTNDVYDYWISKRSKLRKPLLRTFWPTTATNDTNPHMVFRPREKEKYKLRKKRQNDMDTLRKLKVLRNDFDRLRQILELVSRREKVLSSVLSLRHDWFDQQRYDCTDTTGLQRRSCLSNKSEGNIIRQASPHFLHTSATASSLTGATLQLDQLNKLLEETSSTYDSTTKRGSHNKNNLKRKRSGGGGASSSGRSTPVPSDSGNSTMSTATASTTADDGGGGVASGNTSKGGRRGGSTIRLGEDHGVYLTTPGDPNVVNAGVPNFVQPLKARQEYISSWDENVPFVESYSGGKALSFTEFRHRGRIGRGGRICIDRIPGRTTHDDRHTTSTDFGSKASSTAVFEYAGHPPSYVPQHNLNVPTVFPVYMDADEKETKRRRIEEIAAVDDDVENETDLDNIHVELVPMKDWLDTDDQKWGEETLALGPV